MTLDDYLFEIVDEYDGFQYKSSLNEDELRLKLAEYACACLGDSKLAEEALKICKEKQ